MLIFSAAPLMVHAEDSDELVFASDSNSNYYSFSDFISSCDSTDKYFCFKFSSTYNGNPVYLTGAFSISQSDFNSVVISSYDGVYTLIVPDRIEFSLYNQFTNQVSGKNFHELVFDSNNNKLYLYDSNHNLCTSYMFLDSNILSTDFIYYDLITNIFDIVPSNPLNLSISFEPDLSGTVSRTSVHNGKEYTSTTLDLHVTNNGDDAQFSMFIVPSGDDITFPDSIITNNQGFIGSPVYAYVTDEWLAFSVAGFQGNALYAPCVWHTVPSGYVNQIYHIPWNHMSLDKSISYDVVVYACSNTITGVEKGVDADLSDVVEIYRSTFTITDPAAYDPSGDAFGDHPWNPDEDHTSLWNTSSAFRDDNGNVVIKGQTREGGGYVLTEKGFVTLDTFSSSSMSSSIRRGFDNFLGFVNYIFNRLPGDLSTIYKYGYLSVVVLCIIKAVFT
jgi:hypothetical protein